MSLDSVEYRDTSEAPTVQGGIPMTQVVIDFSNDDEDEDDMYLIMGDANPEPGISRSQTDELEENSETDKSLDYVITGREDTLFMGSSDTEMEEIEDENISYKTQKTITPSLPIGSGSRDFNLSAKAEFAQGCRRHNQELFSGLKNQGLQPESEDQIQNVTQQQERKLSSITNGSLGEGLVGISTQEPDNQRTTEEETSHISNREVSDQKDKSHNNDINNDIQITKIRTIPPKMDMDELRPLLSESKYRRILELSSFDTIRAHRREKMKIKTNFELSRGLSRQLPKNQSKKGPD